LSTEIEDKSKEFDKEYQQANNNVQRAKTKLPASHNNRLT